MTRRTAEVTIPKDGAEVPERRRNRDGGKTFIITEWPAMVAEKWADRALVAIGNSTAKVDYVMGSGMAGIAFLGLRSLLGVSEGPALALTDELMQCVTIKVQLAPEGRPLVENDIEEVTTIWRLKSEAFALHTGFSWAEISQMLISAGSKAEGLANTLSTSRKPSGSLSRPRRRPTKHSPQA